MLETILYSGQKSRGLICIRNLQSSKTYLVSSEDIGRDIKDIRFSLDLGTFDHAPLQEEYDAIGLELFAIEPYRTANTDEDLAELLQTCRQALHQEGMPSY